MLAVAAHTILKLEETARAALNDASLREIVDNFRRHAQIARQSVSCDRRKGRPGVGVLFFVILVGSFHRSSRERRAAECRDEIAPPHYSITSSARTSTAAGTSRPSALAAFRLMTVWYLVGAWTGRSAGFSPLRMRST